MITLKAFNYASNVIKKLKISFNPKKIYLIVTIFLNYIISKKKKEPDPKKNRGYCKPTILKWNKRYSKYFGIYKLVLQLD